MVIEREVTFCSGRSDRRLNTSGRSLAIPVGLERRPAWSFLQQELQPLADASGTPGAQSISRAGKIVPGMDLSHYAYVNTAVHHNLYRISLP